MTDSLLKKIVNKKLLESTNLKHNMFVFWPNSLHEVDAVDK